MVSSARCPHCGQVIIDRIIGIISPAELGVLIRGILGSAFIWQRSHAFLDCLLQNRDLLFVQKIAGELASLQSSPILSLRETLFQCRCENFSKPLRLVLRQRDLRCDAAHQSRRDDPGFFFTQRSTSAPRYQPWPD
jgi:hypothetical protein